MRLPPSLRLALLPVAALLSLALVLAVATSSRAPVRPPASAARPPDASRVPAAPGNEGTRFLGVVLSREALELSSAVDGRLKRLCCSLGARVRKGETVASLASPVTAHDEASARAELAVAQAELSRTTLELAEATERLARRRDVNALALSAEELATATYAKGIADARQRAAEARISEQRALLDRTRARLEETRLLAPFDARVAAVYAAQGALLRAGQPVVRLVGNESIIRFGVPEDVVSRLPVGTRVHARVSDTAEPLRASVVSVAPELDTAVQLVLVEARLDAQGPGAPLSGTPVEVTLDAPASGEVPRP